MDYRRRCVVFQWQRSSIAITEPKGTAEGALFLQGSAGLHCASGSARYTMARKTRNRFGVSSLPVEESDDSRSVVFLGGWAELNTRNGTLGSGLQDPAVQGEHVYYADGSPVERRAPSRPKSGRSNKQPGSAPNEARSSMDSDAKSRHSSGFNSRRATDLLIDDIREIAEANKHDQRRSITPEPWRFRELARPARITRSGSGPMTKKRETTPSSSSSIPGSSRRSSVSMASSAKPLLGDPHAENNNRISEKAGAVHMGKGNVRNANNLGVGLVAKIAACAGGACSNGVPASAASAPAAPAAAAAAATGTQAPNCFSQKCVLLSQGSGSQAKPGLEPANSSAPLQLQRLWVDKHRPENLGSFLINSEQAQFLKQLISRGHCHHLLFQGPSGAGKKTLINALLREIFGAAVWQISQEIRSFQIQGTTVRLPITYSAHHVEINLSHVGEYVRHVLLTLLKEIKLTSEMARTDMSTADYKVLVLHDADKVSAEAQQHVRWLMERYADNCKMMLCCQETGKMLDSIQSRCVVVNIEAPTIDEVVQILQFVAKKEGLHLPDSFARRIAILSDSNLRQAVLSLEACKLHKYPFEEDQPILTGWEKDIVAMANDIIGEQTPKRLFEVRGKIHKLLTDGVAAKLIHRRLVEELVKLLDSPLKDEVYQWAKFYARKLPEGNDAIFKLEEFVAKLMSVYKKFPKQLQHTGEQDY